MPLSRQDRQQQLEARAAEIRVCLKCPLHASRTMAVPGEGTVESRFMIVGEAPGRDEDRTGRPFVGAAGRFLDQMLEGTGLRRADFFITNIVKCRPPRNRAPKAIEIQTCTQHYLFDQIELVDPRLIVLLGGIAVKTLLGAKTVEAVRGRVVERDGRRFLATYHPASQFYREDLAQKIRQDFSLLQQVLSELKD